MKNLVTFLVLAIIIILSACEKEENITSITPDPEKTIHEKFNSAQRLSKYSGDVYQIDSVRREYPGFPWSKNSPDGLLTDITVLFQDSVLTQPGALWRNQVLGSGPLLVMYLSAYLDYVEIYYNGAIINNEDFIMMYVNEVRQNNDELFMSWESYNKVWLELNLKTKQWTYQPD